MRRGPYPTANFHCQLICGVTSPLTWNEDAQLAVSVGVPLAVSAGGNLTFQTCPQNQVIKQLGPAGQEAWSCAADADSLAAIVCTEGKTIQRTAGGGSWACGGVPVTSAGLPLRTADGGSSVLLASTGCPDNGTWVWDADGGDVGEGAWVCKIPDPFFERRTIYYAPGSFTDTVFRPTGSTTGSTNNGTAGAETIGGRRMVRFTSATGGCAYHGTQLGTAMVDFTSSPVLRADVRTGADLSNERIWIGFNSGTSTGVICGDPVDRLVGNHVGMAAAAPGFPNWLCCASDGTNLNCEPVAGTAFDVDTDYLVEVAVSSTAVTCKVNGVSGNVASNLPTATTGASVLVEAATVDASTTTSVFGIYRYSIEFD